MSSQVKRAGTTSKLLMAIDCVLKSHKDTQFYDIVNEIATSHKLAAEEVIQDKKILESVKFDIEEECDRLTSFLQAASILGELTSRSKDMIIGTGERLVAQLFTAVLNDKGTPAAYVNLERVLDNIEVVNNVLDLKFYAAARKEMWKAVQQVLPRLPVITGYFGFVPGGILQVVGRGYSDFTAALIAAESRATEMQVWKEVDGIFSADPGVVKTAHILSSITPNEAAELTYYGSEVIHPFTMEQIMRAGIPLRIKNTFKAKEAGTVVEPVFKEPKEGKMTSPQLNTRCLVKEFMNKEIKPISKKPTALTVKKGICVINVQSNRKMGSFGFMAKMFKILKKYQIVVDLITTSEAHVSIAFSATLHNENTLKAALQGFVLLGKVHLIRGLAIVSLVSEKTKQMIDMAGKMFSVLGDQGIGIEMISQGASKINVSCVVSESMADRAAIALHDSLIL
eukprot:TRINITY_DN6998_c0_g1_i25.p1 TRINITY_DN6998_c0_g1~~TRINITY_DN6998_c0_g1_i25.p1  ORF type:complete len:453 (-),score=96.99 TRINITY_DN6998_c0_g1_i25:247-1605(-)